MPISRHNSLAVGFDALRANPLRTLLSTLGVVMGVGAMVSVLSMGDGVERFAREQIERTTDLLGITITPSLNTNVDGQFVRREDVLRFTVIGTLTTHFREGVMTVLAGRIFDDGDTATPARAAGVPPCTHRRDPARVARAEEPVRCSSSI